MQHDNINHTDILLCMQGIFCFMLYNYYNNECCVFKQTRYTNTYIYECKKYDRGFQFCATKSTTDPFTITAVLHSSLTYLSEKNDHSAEKS